MLQFPLTSAPQKTNQSGRDAWNKKLIVWYFEDQLKQRYERFVVELQVSRSFRPRLGKEIEIVSVRAVSRNFFRAGGGGGIIISTD